MIIFSMGLLFFAVWSYGAGVAGVVGLNSCRWMNDRVTQARAVGKGLTG